MGKVLQVVPPSGKCLLVAQWSDMFYTSGAQGPKRSRVRDWRPWKECPRKLMDPSTLHWACQAPGPGKRHPRRNVRGSPEWALVGPLICFVDWNNDCRLVSQCHSRRYTILCELQWDAACLTPCWTGKREGKSDSSWCQACDRLATIRLFGHSVYCWLWSSSASPITQDACDTSNWLELKAVWKLVVYVLLHPVSKLGAGEGDPSACVWYSGCTYGFRAQGQLGLLLSSTKTSRTATSMVHPEPGLLMWTRPQANVGRLKNTEEAKAFRRKLMARPLALRCDTTYDHLDVLAIVFCTRSCTTVPLYFQLHQDPAQLLKLATHWAFHLSLLVHHCNVIQASSRYKLNVTASCTRVNLNGLKLRALLCAWFQTRCWRGANLCQGTPLLDPDQWVPSSCIISSRAQTAIATSKAPHYWVLSSEWGNQRKGVSNSTAPR